MPEEPYHPDPEEAIRRENKIRRGLDPDFNYSSHRFATAAALRLNVPFFIQTFGLKHIAFILLTFRRWIRIKDAWRKLNNVWRRFFREVFGHFITVVEFTLNGRLHFHVAVQVLEDIRTGFSFPAYTQYKISNDQARAEGRPLTCKQRRALRDSMPANPALRSLWRKLDEGLTGFGFGPIYDLFPIETNETAIAKYLTKGFLGGLPRQQAADKGARLVSYSKGCPRKVPAGWRPPSPWFERRLRALVQVFGFSDPGQFKERLGSRWAHSVMELIHWMEFDFGKDWADFPLYLLTPIVLNAILNTGRIRHYLGCLIPDVEAMLRATDNLAGPSAPLPPPWAQPA